MSRFGDTGSNCPHGGFWLQCSRCMEEIQRRERERVEAMPRVEQIREDIERQRAHARHWQIGAPFPANITLDAVEVLLAEIDRLRTTKGGESDAG